MDTVLILRHLTEITAHDEIHQGVFFSLAADFGDEFLDNVSSFGILAHFLEVTDFWENSNSVTSIYEADWVYQNLYEVVRIIICKQAIYWFRLVNPVKYHFFNLLGLVRVWNLGALFDLFLEKFTSLQGFR